MVWILFGLVGVVLVGGIVVLLMRQVPFDPMAEAVSTTPDTGLPTGPMTPDDVDGLRFDTALRGYRMDQVDEALDVLRGRVAELEHRLAPAPTPALAPLAPDGAGGDTAPAVSADPEPARPLDRGLDEPAATAYGPDPVTTTGGATAPVDPAPEDRA